MVVPPQGGFTGAIVPVTMEADQWLYVPICFNTWLNTPGDPGWVSNTRWSHKPFTDPNTGITYHTYEAWVREVMEEYMDTITPTSTIDGRPVRDIDMYRMQTGLFDITVPEDNAWGSWLPADTYGPALVDGWFAILYPMTPGKLDESDGVLTGCALGIAQTGTIVLDDGTHQGRRVITLLPDYHLCAVYEDQIVDLVPEAITRLHDAVLHYRRPLTFISSPSATSDIELSRVEGVHGPRTLHVLVVNDR